MTIEAHGHEKLDGSTFAGREPRSRNLEGVFLFSALGLILTAVALLVSGSEIANILALAGG